MCVLYFYPHWDLVARTFELFVMQAAFLFISSSSMLSQFPLKLARGLFRVILILLSYIFAFRPLPRPWRRSTPGTQRTRSKTISSWSWKPLLLSNVAFFTNRTPNFRQPPTSCSLGAQIFSTPVSGPFDRNSFGRFAKRQTCDV